MRQDDAADAVKNNNDETGNRNGWLLSGWGAVREMPPHLALQNVMVFKVLPLCRLLLIVNNMQRSQNPY
ncbi:hypothetical protein [Spirulina subsalsa]|uniref:hypothetical protein n=1 Tax=Spirulina subsalsa TaxID=54311 RepID=UPI00232EE7E2|nr:hypothetical protein [Spirulina subsalsa]